MGRCAYPDTVNLDYGLINSDLSFNTVGKEDEEKGEDKVVLPAISTKTRPDVKCFECKKKGHFSNQCLNTQETATTMLTVKAEKVFQFTMIVFKSKEGDNDSLPLLWIHTATNSSRNEEREGDNSSIGTFFSIPPLNSNTRNSNTNDDSVGSGFDWDNCYFEDTKSECKEEGDKESLSDCRSDSNKGKFIFTNIAHIGKKVVQKGSLDKDWLLLDNQSTASIMINPKLVINIRKAGKQLHMGRG
eukprot:12655630-Ditylum_brightwellii.AAC.2